MIEENVFEGLITVAGEIQAKKIRKVIEKHAIEHQLSKSLEHKNLQKYFLIYERKEKLLELILQYKQILFYTKNHAETESHYKKILKEHEEEFINLNKTLEVLDIPLLLK